MSALTLRVLSVLTFVWKVIQFFRLLPGRMGWDQRKAFLPGWRWESFVFILKLTVSMFVFLSIFGSDSLCCCVAYLCALLSAQLSFCDSCLTFEFQSLFYFLPLWGVLKLCSIALGRQRKKIGGFYFRGRLWTFIFILHCQPCVD